MGVIQVLFLVLHLLLTIFVSSNLCCISKFMMKLQQNKRYENQTILDLILVDGSACPLIPQLKTKVFPIVFIIKCRVVNRI